MSRLARLNSTLTLSLLLSACITQGPDQIIADRFDYNNAVATSANEQMLLNLVRLRYGDQPTFLQVNSVLTQYIWSGAAGVDATGGASMGTDQWSVGAGGSYRYVERPTITYTPLAGKEFAQQLTTPVPIELVFSLVQSGWPPEQLLVMGIHRIHDLHSLATFAVADFEPGSYERFTEAMRIFVLIATRGGVESQISPEGEGTRLLVFNHEAPPETQQLIADFKGLIGLDSDASSFNITTRIIGRAPSDVTVRLRSVLDIMGFLALGVEPPKEHVENGRAAPGVALAGVESLIPLQVGHSSDPPTDAFVAIRYADHWFHIPNSDHPSKQSFSMLSYLFQMQAPSIQGAGPLVTVPTG